MKWGGGYLWAAEIGRTCKQDTQIPTIVIYITLSDLLRSTGWGEGRRAWIWDIKNWGMSTVQWHGVVRRIPPMNALQVILEVQVCVSPPPRRVIGLSPATEIAATNALSIYQKTRLVQRFSLIVSTSSLVPMVAIWLPKRHLVRALNRNSAIKAGETACSLSCIQIIIILFVGSLIFRLWTKGWWVNSVTALILGTRFGWEGYKMVRPKFRW